MIFFGYFYLVSFVTDSSNMHKVASNNMNTRHPIKSVRDWKDTIFSRMKEREKYEKKRKERIRDQLSREVPIPDILLDNRRDKEIFNLKFLARKTPSSKSCEKCEKPWTHQCKCYWLSYGKECFSVYCDEHRAENLTTCKGCNVLLCENHYHDSPWHECSPGCKFCGEGFYHFSVSVERCTCEICKENFHEECLDKELKQCENEKCDELLYCSLECSKLHECSE